MRIEEAAALCVGGRFFGAVPIDEFSGDSVWSALYQWLTREGVAPKDLPLRVFVGRTTYDQLLSAQKALLWDRSPSATGKTIGKAVKHSEIAEGPQESILHRGRFLQFEGEGVLVAPVGNSDWKARLFEAVPTP